MGFKTLKTASFAIGKAAAMQLLMRCRNNFVANELRIVDLEASPPVFPIGSIHMFAGSSYPAGFLLCDGSSISRTTYAALFAIIGTAYNTGGEAGTHFRIPNQLGRCLIGNGTGSGLTARTIGSIGGAETHVLSTAELGTHSHAVVDPTHRHLISEQELDNVGGLPDKLSPSSGGGATADLNTGSNTAMNLTAGNTGGGGSHANVQPSIVVNFLIKT